MRNPSGAWRLLWVFFLAAQGDQQKLQRDDYGDNGMQRDRVVQLPGQPMVNFDQYAGYVTVNEKDGRALFYWLTETRQSSRAKPLVLWLNGGPGCSSIAYGASEEIGPFRLDKTGDSLHLNKFSWNKLANLLFLESPAGVGFSYTNTSSNLNDTGDKRTAEDALIFLINWFARFPRYKYREFYITGESYGGHYVPQLAKKIVDYNKGISRPFINLKGFMVGNAVIDSYHDSLGTVNYWWSHALISDSTFEDIMSHCDFNMENTTPACDHYVNYATNFEFGKIDQYGIYSPVCSNGTSRTFVRFKNTLLTLVAGYDPCTESYAEIYYNRPDVQKALHANTTGIPYRWTGCSDVLIRKWKDSDFSILPIYKELIGAGLRIWVYSGDIDAVVPVTATRYSLQRLRLPIKTRWYPWYINTQVGGWTEVYDGLTFSTIRGAGHEVPLFQPRSAFQLFKSFLSGKRLPES